MMYNIQMTLSYCVMVLAIGDIFYKYHAMAILKHYFILHSIPYHFITTHPSIETRNSHPSWMKLLAHSILPGYDFIIAWDLDLLPISPDIDIIKDFDMKSICVTQDSFAKQYPNQRFLPSFKYNGGLLGIPSSYSSFMEGIFTTFAPGKYPSYEQYYLNEELQKQSIPVHELPSDLNVLYSFEGFNNARLQHYTYTSDAKTKIQDHFNRYFKAREYDTRIDMIRSLVPNDAKICELGVFKGDMSKSVKLVLNPSMYVLIDFFQGNMGSADQDGNGFEYVELDNCYKHLLDYFKEDETVHILKGDGIASLNTYPDATFDMIYIDADHSYEGCKRDLETSYRKLKEGGYLMGHDYEMNMKKATRVWECGVKQAVDEFCKNNGVHICAKGLDGCVSYAIKKVSEPYMINAPPAPAPAPRLTIQNILRRKFSRYH